MMKKYFKLMRIKHYIKNMLIFVPLFFSQSMFESDKIRWAVVGYLAFCFVCSAVYIFNDLQDAEKDRLHAIKKNRPIACGEVSYKTACVFIFVCIMLTIGCNYFTSNPGEGALYLFGYLILNIWYSMGLKNMPILDVIILSCGFILRLLYGAMVTQIEVSGWLYLTIFSATFYLGLGKRRNEWKGQAAGITRDVLLDYTFDFLDKNMYVFLGLTDTFYALWAIEQPEQGTVWTVPIVMVILMKYSFDIEGDSDGDPVEVVLKDRWLIVLGILYSICMYLLLYV